MKCKLPLISDKKHEQFFSAESSGNPGKLGLRMLANVIILVLGAHIDTGSRSWAENETITGYILNRIECRFPYTLEY